MPDSTKDRPPLDMAPSLLHTESGQDTPLEMTGAGAGAGAGASTHRHHQRATEPVGGAGTAWHPLDALSASPSSSYKRMSHPTSLTNNNNNGDSSLHHSARHEHLAPLSIALPVSASSRTNGSNHNNNSNTAPSGSFSAGYLDQRRDTFHSLSQTHNMNGSSTSGSSHHQHHNTSNNGNGYNNNNSISWQNYSSSSPAHTFHHNHHHDDHTSVTTHHPQPLRPQSISYASHQHPLQMHHTLLQQTSPTTSSMTDQDPTTTNAAIMRRRRLSTASTSSKRGTGNSSSNLRAKASNTPHHTRRFTTLISDQEPDTTYLWGYLLFFCTMVGFTVSMYALVASNYMPLTGNKTLDWIKKDSHYCMLVPVTIPVTVLFVLFNWLGMKLFRHN